MYDSFHAHIEEKNQAEAIQSCAAETIHVHVSENDRGTPGTGQVNWESFFGGLKKSGYDGYLTIEAFGTALPALAAATKVWRPLFPDAMGLCRDGLAFMKKHAEVIIGGRDGGRSMMRTSCIDSGISLRYDFVSPSSAASRERAWARCCRRQPPAQTPASVALKPQTRAHGQAVPVDPASITIDDGDSVFIRWPGGDE